MNHSRAWSETQPGEFRTFDDFLNFARGNCDQKAKFNFTKSDGTEVWLYPEEAINTLEKVRKFLTAPDRATSPTLDDGRQIVVGHNFTNLTQHLRWACGLDADTAPRKRLGEMRTRDLRWPGTALLWFWSNGGPPLEGYSGDYDTWASNLHGFCDVLRDVERHVREIPPALVLAEAPF